MTEPVVAGEGRPIDQAEMRGLVASHLESDKDYIEKARVLRNRIANGEGLIASADPTKFDVVGSQARLNELKRELVQMEWGHVVSVGLVLGYSLALVAAEDIGENMEIPPRSFARVSIPGFVDVSMNLAGFKGKDDV